MEIYYFSREGQKERVRIERGGTGGKNGTWDRKRERRRKETKKG